VKGVLKNLANGVSWLLALPVAILVRLAAPWDGGDGVFALGSELMSLIPGAPGVYIRRAYYRTVLEKAGTGFVVGFGTVLAQRGIELGNDCYLGTHCNIGLSVIGDDVLLGSGVHVISGTRVHHFERTDVPIREQGGELLKVVIGRDVWAGNGALIMADVGDGAVVGAGAVVTRAVEPFKVAVGNPAKAVKTRGEAPEEQ